ncbi:MAG: hypothetical protein M1826_006861 [Phylliscum demangeonii]|nr:MAG: hypothetical protein M1826_006861 [Phylliscum demangeonii]
MTAYPEYFSPAALAVDLGARGFFDEVDDDSQHRVMHVQARTDRTLDGHDGPDGHDGQDELSPKTAEWAEFSDPDTLSSASTTAFFRPPPAQTAAPVPWPSFRAPVESWPSAACTPTLTPAREAFAVDFAPAVAMTIATGPAPYEVPDPTIFPPPLSADRPSFPTSPEVGWSSPTLADAIEVGRLSGRARANSAAGLHAAILRRDGIRKKNARFEIPAERNLMNIDQLIAQSSDDHEIKELKQQKRLLRNRQAALDSRQRKKLHTERLEEEKKQYTNLIADLEEECARLKIRDAEHHRLQEEWALTQQRYERYLESVHLAKEEMIRRHTLETADLRKKNAFLTEHVPTADGAVAMSAVASSAAFAADVAELDGLGLDPSGWNEYGFMHDFAVEADAKPVSTLAVVPARGEKGAVADEHPSATSGLLLLLLLCGAFVASKSSTTSVPAIPRMPDSIRAASATVLDNIFKDAGVAPPAPGRLVSATPAEALAPAGSALSWARIPTGADDGLVGLSSSSLDVLQRQLLQPTKEQEAEQLFSLTAEQYNSLMCPPDAPLFPESGLGPRPLDAGLAALRKNPAGSSAAEVYTRSLLWDKVPADVVREFAQFVADSAAHDERPEVHE